MKSQIVSIVKEYEIFNKNRKNVVNYNPIIIHTKTQKNIYLLKKTRKILFRIKHNDTGGKNPIKHNK